MGMITLSFESYEEMIEYARNIIGDAPQTVKAELPKTAQTPYSAQTAQATQLPVQAMTGQPTPTQPSQPVVQPAPVQQAAPSVTHQAAGAQVPTTQRTYTQDELAGAAMQLMDKGLQTQLQELLAGYGVEALPALPPEQFGNFATALRGLGAQI